jgi:hypothetical protein
MGVRDWLAQAKVCVGILMCCGNVVRGCRSEEKPQKVSAGGTRRMSMDLL